MCLRIRVLQASYWLLALWLHSEFTCSALFYDKYTDPYNNLPRSKSFRTIDLAKEPDFDACKKVEKENMIISCGRYTGVCGATCKRGYTFTTGENRYFLTCDHGKWVPEEGVLPSCSNSTLRSEAMDISYSVETTTASPPTTMTTLTLSNSTSEEYEELPEPEDHPGDL